MKGQPHERTIEFEGSDPVLVHPRWLTVHEVDPATGIPSCGNGTHGKITYTPMTRGQARAVSGSHNCAVGGCRAARDRR